MIAFSPFYMFDLMAGDISIYILSAWSKLSATSGGSITLFCTTVVFLRMKVTPLGAHKLPNLLWKNMIWVVEFSTQSEGLAVSYSWAHPTKAMDLGPTTGISTFGGVLRGMNESSGLPRLNLTESQKKLTAE
ncbi:unnamed protein product [Musa textilis]